MQRAYYRAYRNQSFHLSQFAPSRKKWRCPAASDFRSGHLTGQGGHIRRRCICQPTDHQAILLQRLGLNLPKNLPFDGKFLKPM
jgi:hypothetical protein